MRRPGSIEYVKKIIRKTLYSLKWRYGFPVDIYREVKAGFNTETGKDVVTLEKYHINRMIVLPGLQHTNVFFSITYIKANSNFVTGGDVGLDDRQFIIDSRDLPANFVLLPTDYLVWARVRYDIRSFEALEADTGYFVMARRVNRDTPLVIDELLHDQLTVSGGFTVGP